MHRHMGAHIALRQAGHGQFGFRRCGNRILATLDAIDNESRLLSSPLRGDISMPPDGHALQPFQSPALDHIHFSARRIDPHAEARKIMVPEDGVLVLDGERVDGAFGDPQIASSGHRGRRPTHVP